MNDPIKLAKRLRAHDTDHDNAVDDAIALLEKLYDETPIDAAWVEQVGGEWWERQKMYRFPTDRDLPAHIANECVRWQMVSYRGSHLARTRGEFRRAAELLGIVINEAANAAKGGA